MAQEIHEVGESSNANQPMISLHINEDEITSYSNNFLKKIGSGKFGTVYEGRIGGQDVAIKVSKHTSFIEEFENEMQCLRDSDHPNIIKMFGYCRTPERYYIVTELASRGDLYTNMPALNWEQTLTIFREVASAIQHVHSRNLRIGDVKTQNVLLDNDFHAKLCDIGSIGPEGPCTNIVGTFGFIDPYAIERDSLTKSDDVYSLGVIILQLVTKGEVIQGRRHITDCVHESFLAGHDPIDKKLKKTGCASKDAKRILELGLLMTVSGRENRLRLLQFLRGKGKDVVDPELQKRMPTEEVNPEKQRMSIEEVINRLDLLRGGTTMARIMSQLKPNNIWGKMKKPKKIWGKMKKPKKIWGKVKSGLSKQG